MYCCGPLRGMGDAREEGGGRGGGARGLAVGEGGGRLEV